LKEREREKRQCKSFFLNIAKFYDVPKFGVLNFMELWIQIIGLRLHSFAVEKSKKRTQASCVFATAAAAESL